MIEKKHFGYTKNNVEVFEYRITNRKGNYIDVINYGARIRNICFSGKNGKLVDVCLGYDTLIEYEEDEFYLGASVGRYANRIEKGEFCLNGKKYSLPQNEKDFPNHIHGGYEGFSDKIWNVETTNDSLVFTYRFLDGEEGYPGNMDVTMTYTWDDEDRLIIDYKAVSDADTIINFTNHSYFNLSGKSEELILDHELVIYADKMLPVDPNSIPLGEIADTKGTVFDFSYKHKIGDRINEDNEQLIIGKGYDHNYVFGNSDMKEMAYLYCDKTGISMTCSSTEPGMQFYSGNNLKTAGKNGDKYPKNAGLCLETQKYPDSINHEEYPTPVLKAGEEFESTTIYKFNVN